MATIIGCLRRASIGVHTKRKIRGQISVFSIRKNPQISLSFNNEMEIYKQGLLEPAKLCTVGKARKARIAQGHLKGRVWRHGSECVYILCLNFYFSFLSWSKSEAPQMPQCIHKWKRKWSKLCLRKCIQYQNASVHGRTRMLCNPQHHISLSLKGNTSVEDFLGRS